MKPFRIHFAISAQLLDPEGFLVSREVNTFATPAELEPLLGTDLSVVLGGYVLVSNGSIWNSTRPARFDPLHVRCEMDYLSYGAPMLEDVADRMKEPDAKVCTLFEMVSLGIEPVRPNSITISGVNMQGGVVYRPETVDATTFARELLSATNDFVRVAEEHLRRGPSTAPGDARSPVVEKNRALVERFRRGAERLERAGQGRWA